MEEVVGEIILDHNTLAERIRGLKAQGKRIVFTNGCFELFHVGHLRSFIDARSKGDVLVVALNGDEGVSALKGPGRPVVNESERAELIAALNCVEFVTIFNEPTADNILNLLKPDVYAKGTDNTPDKIPERHTVMAYGGEIAIVGDPKSHSTTQLINYISEVFAVEK